MAFKKYGAAIIERARISLGDWGSVRKKAGKPSELKVDPRLLRLGKFSPDRFLLTHCTIISSVDLEKNDYYITAKTAKYVNSNDDAWERRLLLSTYPTFRGAENYLEHVQIPTLSKGKILDAVARDLGDSVYVDILVATNRKHADLITKIESGELTGLSMGCHVAYTICSRCGNKAHDETELCPHILYGKGDLFIDEGGVERKIAELCGHKDDPDSVVFIEASWVKNPAFVGAVNRGPLQSLDAETLAAALEIRGVKHSSLHGLNMRKVARFLSSEELKSRAGVARKKYVQNDPRLFDEPMPDVDEPRNPEDLDPNQNENLGASNHRQAWLKNARLALGPKAYKLSDTALFAYEKILTVGSRRGWEALKDQITQRQLLTAVVLSDRIKGHKGFTPRLAKVLEATGPLSLYTSESTFLDRCAGLLNRPLVSAEIEMLLRYGGLMGKFAEGRRIVSV